MNEYDLIIIGGGAGAFAAAIKANELGAKTALVNAGLPVGGTCVNVGCVPSKTLLKIGEIAYYSGHGFKSINGKLTVDFEKAIEEELELVDKMRHDKYVEVLSNLKNVTHFEGKATFVSKTEIEVNGQKLYGEKFVIATGSTALPAPLEGLERVSYITHIDALKLKKLPKSMVVIGAGPLGLEFGQMYHHFGTKVTILQKGPAVMPRTEPELSQALQKYLEDEGIAIFINADSKALRKENGEVVVSFEVDGKPQEVRGEVLMFASGKTPNTKDLDLEKAGVKVNEKRAIKVNDELQTSATHVFAAGDVTDKPLRLETTAGKEGNIATENALKGTHRKMDYSAVPYAVFTTPNLAGVGKTDEEAINAGFSCTCNTFPFEYVPKASIIHDTRGLVKIVADNKTHQVYGIHILGPEAADLVHEAVMIVKNKMTLEDVIDTVHVFPTLSESTKLAAQNFFKDVAKLSCCIE
ncbi:mercury(II) reductase [Candidatus Curtissbacteria bacterium]|nr:mercury(II) reductase [Candidatus Curtissbacteria bacterium]